MDSSQKLRFMRKAKRFRSAFTTEQVKYLEQHFKKFPYINSELRKEVAATLDMQERAVKIWFQNRRMREKKETYNKEIDSDNERLQKDIIKNQLNNASLPSKEFLSHSLSKPTDVDGTKSNFNVINQPQNTTHQLKELFKSTPTSPYYKISSYTSKFSDPFELNKKYKDTDRKPDKIKIGKELVNEPAEHKSFLFPEKIPEDLTTLPETCSRIQANALNKPAYFSVVPSIYPNSFTPGRFVWKPMNYIPVVATGSPLSVPSNIHGSVSEKQKKKCSCNCHSSSHLPVAFDPSINNPYAQYVLSVPFQSSDPHLRI